MIYSLSSRQTKTILVSRQPLLIYIPCPVPIPTDLIAWAKEHLQTQTDLITKVTLETAICEPATRNGNYAVNLFGILRTDWDSSKHCYCIPVVAVLLRTAAIRGGVVGPMWPGVKLESPFDSDATEMQPEPTKE